MYMNLFRQFVGATLLGLLISTASLAAEKAKIGPRIGQTAPEFSITDLAGKQHSLKQLREKGHVLLIFWSTRCHYCTLLIPQLKEIHKKYQKKGLTLAAINVGYEDRDEVDTYVFEHKIKYLVLNHDNTKGDIAEAYRLVGTPTLQLIAPDGTVKYRGHQIPQLEQLIQVAGNKATN
jgi:peroxiredoxin